MTTRQASNLLHITIILILSFTKAQENIKEIITNTAGPKQLRSQNYPENYPPNQHREWIFNQTSGKWAVTINDFQLEDSQQCQNDYLLIRRSNSKSVTPLMLCGSKPSHSYVSEGPYLHIEFHSDTEKQAKGFSILVEYLMTGDDAKQFMGQKMKGKEVKLLTHVENEELFIGLLGVLSLAAVLFFSMLGCFVVGLMKRHHESAMQRNMVTMLQAQMSNPPLERRYSRKGSVKEQKRPVLMQSLSNQSTTALLSYQSAGYPQTGDHV